MNNKHIVRERELDAAALRRGAMRLARRLRRERSSAALSGAMLSVLSELHRRGELTPRELADADRVQPQSLSRTLAALERRGLVNRRVDSLDRRRSKLGLTAAGLEALTADMAERDAWLATALERLSPAERALLGVAAELMEQIAES